MVERLRLVRDKLGYEFDIEDLIYDLSVSISILSKDGLEYKFPHRSLQDYFTALFIKSQSDFSKKRIYAEKLDKVKVFGFLNHRDLFDLLIELDKESFYEYCIIPLVNEFTLRFPKSEIEASVVKLLKFLEVSITIREETSLFIISNGGRRVFSFIEVGNNYDIDFHLESKEISKDSSLGSHIEELKGKGGLVVDPNEKSKFVTTRNTQVNYEILATVYFESLKEYILDMNSLEEKLNRELSDEKLKKVSIWDF